MFLLQASIWDEYGGDVKSLLVIAIGILIYALIVNGFYQIISRRVMFGKKGADGRVHVGGPGRGFVYLLVFPLIGFAFFLVISASLLFLSGDGEGAKTPTEVFVLAMGIVLAVRIAAYFSEATSHDVAKMLPLGLLGVFLVTENTTSLDATLLTKFKNITEIFTNLETIALFFGIVVLVEYLLRLFYVAAQATKGPPKPKRKDAPAPAAARQGYQGPPKRGQQPPQMKR